MKSLLLTAAVLLSISTPTPAADSGGFKTGVYPIVSGKYTECCGIAGPLTVRLPNDSQAFVELSIDSATSTARLSFLRDDMLTILRSISNGVVRADSIQFGMLIPPMEPAEGGLYFTVKLSKNATNALRIQGEIVSSQTGPDVVNHFTYSDVEIVLASGLTAEIRVSEVEVCWNSTLGQRYQPQFRTNVQSTVWNNVGTPLDGTGAKQCSLDKMLIGEPRRFYRVITVP